MNNILRTVIRFAIIVIFLILLVVLSIALFKLVPKAVNQLASASLSITGSDKATSTATTTIPVIVNNDPNVVATTTGGLNGVIVINKNPSTTSSSQNTSKPVQGTYYNSAPKTVYYPSTPVRTGSKNIKVTQTALGVIDRYTGQFRATNSFNTDDTVSVRYTLSNTGDTDTGSFAMRVEMPAINSYDQVKYINDLNLEPYSSYSVEARFYGINTTYNPTVRIYTDINNQVAETNESDNTLSVNLNSNPSYNYNNGNNCYYSNGYYYNCGNNYNNGNNGNCYYSNGYYYNCNNGNNNGNCYYQNGYYYNCDNGNNNGNNCYYQNGTYYNCGNNNYGNPNLTISSIELGKMVNGNFYSQTSFAYGDTVAVRVHVRNTGGSFTNYWMTRATFYDNTGTPKNFDTGFQSPISNGNESVYTFEASGLSRGTVSLNVSADYNNNVTESNEGDNTASQTIYIY